MEVVDSQIHGPSPPLPLDETYGDCLSYLRDANEISQIDKEQIFGATLRRVLHWPKPA